MTQQNNTSTEMVDALNSASRGNTRGRIPTPEINTALDLGIPTSLEKKLEQENALVRQVQEVVTAEHLGLAEGFGMVNAFNFINRLTGLAMTKWLADRQDRKDYVGLTVLNRNNETVILKTFKDLCGAVGVSHSKACEDIQNLAIFSEDFLNAAPRLGVGYRQLRELRALPEDARQIIIDSEAVKTNDPEALKDLLEEVAAKNAKLTEDLKGKDGDLAARDKVLAAKNKALDDAQTQLAKLKSLDVEAQEALAAQKQSDALAEVADKAGLALEGMAQFFATLNAALELPDLAAPVRDHLEGAANAVAASLADMFGNRLHWRVDFAGLVYPEWMEQQASNSKPAE